MLKIKGATALKAKLARIQPTVEKYIAKKVESKIDAVFKDVTETTPQWSGNLVMNWRIEFGPYQERYYESQNYVNRLDFDRTRDEVPSYYMGHMRAVRIIRNEELPKLKQLAAVMFLGDKKTFKIKIVNYAPYAREVEMNMGPFGAKGAYRKAIRRVNILEEYGAVAMRGYVLQSNALGKYPLIKV